MMKYNAKIIFTLLCIGFSVNINGLEKLEITINPIMKEAYKNYDPTVKKQDIYSIVGAAAQWAAGLVSELTTQERVALAYSCLNENENTKANKEAKESPDNTIERIIKRVITSDISVPQDYIRALATEHDMGNLIPWSWHPAFGVPIASQFLGWWRGPVTTTKPDYGKQLYWPNIDTYAKRTDALNDKNELKVAYIPNILKEADKDIKTPKFKSNLTLLLDTDIEDITWDDVKNGENVTNNLVNEIFTIINREFTETEGAIAPDEQTLKKLIINEIDKSELEEKFNLLKKGKATGKTKAEKERLANDKQLVKDIIVGWENLILSRDPRNMLVAKGLRQTYDDAKKSLLLMEKGIELNKDKRSELEEMFDAIQVEQPLTEKLKVTSKTLNKNQRYWIDNFVKKAKEDPRASRDKAEEALFKKIDYDFPTNLRSGAKADLKNAADDSIFNYFVEAWETQLTRKEQPTRGTRTMSSTKELRIDAKEFQELKNLNEDQKEWIENFIAQQKQTNSRITAEQAKKALQLKMEIPKDMNPSIQKRLEQEIGQKVSDYFNAAWKAQPEQRQQVPQQPQVRQRQQAQQPSVKQPVEAKPQTPFIATGPQETLMISSPRLTDEQKDWINRFIADAQDNNNAPDAAKDALLKSITFRPNTHPAAQGNILANVGTYFDTQWK